MVFKATNWNKVEDEVDLKIWKALTGQFWLPEDFTISNDKKSWREDMTIEMRWLLMKNFVGLTLLDTLQGQIGADSMKADAITPHEKSNLANISFMEEVHAKSYSWILQLASSEEIERAFQWSENNPYLQKKVELVNKYYQGDDPLKKKIASTFLESFLFYSGFFYVLWLNGNKMMTNSASVVTTIMKDEAIHGFYIGYKFKLAFDQLSAEEKQALREWAEDLLVELYENELDYTRDLFDEVGLSEKVDVFLQYNANKAMQNLGFSDFFPVTEDDVDPIVRNQLDLKGVAHDFFSVKGNYGMAEVKELSDDDFDNIDWDDM